MHKPHEPAYLLDSALPPPLQEIYRELDGGQLFHEAVILRASADVGRIPVPPGAAEPPAHLPSGLLWIGEYSGDDLYACPRGQVIRCEKDTGEWLIEGSRCDRWLLGIIEAEALLYDETGEFIADAFGESGELEPAMAARMCRRILARDRHAPAPRWRLARALSQSGQHDRARDELETVVAEQPDFAWAWFDLAQISLALGQPELALDELVAAAEAIVGYEHAGFFYAHSARVAASLDREDRRAELAARALVCDPDLVRAQREGAQATLEAGDIAAAEILAELAVALAPRDIAVLDVMRRIRTEAALDPR